MADRDWRALERVYLRGEAEALPALNVALRRAGLPIRRDRIIHYLSTDFHHTLGDDGWIDARAGGHAWSSCGMANLGPRSREDRRKDKPCPYTPSKVVVTCKTCLRCLRSPKFEEGKPALHLLIKLPDGTERTRCGGKFGRSTEVVVDIGCTGCVRLISGKARAHGHGLNARGRRRLRRQTMFTGSQSDPFRHGL
jgi:hypothetical protein